MINQKADDTVATLSNFSARRAIRRQQETAAVFGFSGWRFLSPLQYTGRLELQQCGYASMYGS